MQDTKEIIRLLNKLARIADKHKTWDTKEYQRCQVQKIKDLILTQ